MRIVTLAIAAALTLFVSPASTQPSSQRGPVTAFEGARLIIGDGSAPIENGVLVVQDGKLTTVGARGQVSIPSGATRMSLTGKTVMPVMVDLHSHVGFSKDGVFAPEHYTRENIIDQLRRLEYYGVGAILSLGTDPGLDVFGIRDDQRAGKLDDDTARLYVAGRGFVAPGGGPPVSPLEHVEFEVDRPGLARILVRELATLRVDMVKLWVDDRRGTKPKLVPEVYQAIIDEAHKQQLRVMAHVFYLDDAKLLLRAGVDGFAHMIRDKPVDDEFIQLARERNVFFCGAAGVQAARDWVDDPFLAETVSAATLAKIRQSLANAPPAQSSSVQVLLGNIKKLHDAGFRIVFGTDTVTPGRFYGFNQHLELTTLVAAGLSPLDAISIATGKSAEALGVQDLGMLKAGKSADFIVLDANPLEDIANSRKISAVYRRGRMLDRAAMRKAWSTAAS